MSNKDLGLATEIIIMAIVITVILLFVGIGLLVLIHACIVGRSFRNNSANERGRGRGRGRGRDSPERTRNMSQDELENLPSYNFIAKSRGSSPVDCAICLENFKIGDKCRLLPICNHSFHAECVDLWLLKTPICPICRTSTTTSVADSRIAGPVIVEESSHFSDSIDMRGSLTTTDSSHFSDVSIDQSREGQASAIIMELRQSQEGERNRGNSNGGIELTIQNQTNLVATQLSSNPS